MAWQDLDLATGTVRVRRPATYQDGVGMVLGPTKTVRAMAQQLLAPSVVRLLAERQSIQGVDQELAGDAWPEVYYEGERLDPVFTNAAGSLMLRQHVGRALRKAAKSAGLDRSALGTHTGRRSVVTNLYSDVSFDLADVAGFVGHAGVATTRRYIQHEGDRPTQVSKRACELLDPAEMSVRLRLESKAVAA